MKTKITILNKLPNNNIINVMTLVFNATRQTSNSFKFDYEADWEKVYEFLDLEECKYIEETVHE